MKVAIVGSREFPRMDLVAEFVSRMEPGTILVSGGARGVDRYAEQLWRLRGGECEIYKADWQAGKGAGYARNKTIVENADLVVAFWDEKSNGTRHTIELARKARRPLLVITETA